MWKIAAGFIVFAALALFMLSKGGDIDLGGEKHGDDATHAPAVAPESASSVSARSPALAASTPIATPSASK